MISYIVSSYERPGHLLCCLASLANQVCMTNGGFEIIVTCNSIDELEQNTHANVAHKFGAYIFFTAKTFGAKDCYDAAEYVVDIAKGDWLCFPSDDSYYVPLFLGRMLDAAQTHSWDFVYCDMLYTSKWHGWRYEVMDVKPVRQHIDKTCFILRRELFKGFPGKKNGMPCEADGELAEELVKRGVRHGKASGGALVIHN